MSIIGNVSSLLAGVTNVVMLFLSRLNIETGDEVFVNNHLH